MTLKSAYRMVHAIRQRIGLAIPGEQTPPLPTVPPAVLWYMLGGFLPVLAYRAVNTPGSPYPGGPANQAASYINLATPGTYDLVELINPPGWAAATGWSHIGGTGLDTGYTPVNDQDQTLLVRFANAANTPMCGSTWGAGVALVLFPFFAAALGYANGGNGAGAANYLNGNAGVSGNQGYKNGVADGGALGGWTGPATGPLLIGSCVGWGDFAGDILAAVLYRPAIALVQIPIVVAAMALL